MFDFYCIKDLPTNDENLTEKYEFNSQHRIVEEERYMAQPRHAILYYQSYVSTANLVVIGKAGYVYVVHINEQ